jgi:hypothetical protein
VFARPSSITLATVVRPFRAGVFNDWASLSIQRCASLSNQLSFAAVDVGLVYVFQNGERYLTPPQMRLYEFAVYSAITIWIPRSVGFLAVQKILDVAVICPSWTTDVGVFADVAPHVFDEPLVNAGSIGVHPLDNNVRTPICFQFLLVRVGLGGRLQHDDILVQPTGLPRLSPRIAQRSPQLVKVVEGNGAPGLIQRVDALESTNDTGSAASKMKTRFMGIAMTVVVALLSANEDAAKVVTDGYMTKQDTRLQAVEIDVALLMSGLRRAPGVKGLQRGARCSGCEGRQGRGQALRKVIAIDTGTESVRCPQSFP